MAKKSAGVDTQTIGHYAFIVGIVLAILAAFVQTLQGDISVWVMVILGVIVGILNITSKEVGAFLLAAVALMIASSASALSLSIIWPKLTTMLGNIIIFVAPAAIIVALKAVYALAQKK